MTLNQVTHSSDPLCYRVTHMAFEKVILENEFHTDMEFKVMHRIHLEYFTSFTGNDSCFYFIRDHRSQCNALANVLGIYLTHIRVVLRSVTPLYQL